MSAARARSVSAPLVSEAQLDALREFSPAAVRLLRRDPGLSRWLEKPPSFAPLARAKSNDVAAAQKTLRVTRTRMLVHSAYQEHHGRSPLATAALWSRFADAAVTLADRVASVEVELKMGVPLTHEARVRG